jgi:group I intron endonuclease
MIGIYAIKNTINAKTYVGLTTDTGQRFLYHKRRLRDGTHKNGHLQASFNKYGRAVFEFMILEECVEKKLVEKEKFWIAKLDTCNRMLGYNKTFGGEFGRLHPDIYKKYSKLYKNRPISEEQKKKISKTLTGRKRPKSEIAKFSISCRKFNDQTEREMMDLFNYGFSLRNITKLYKTKLTTVSSIRKRWRDKTGEKEICGTKRKKYEK